MSARMTIYKNSVIMVCAECVADDGELAIDHVWNRNTMTDTMYQTFLAIMDQHTESHH